MNDKQYWINQLQLTAHPEGGYYRETYRSSHSIPSSVLADTFSGARSVSTAIYFLLPSDQRSLFHRIKSDELWHFHKGSSLTIFILTHQGVEQRKLGDNPAQGEELQVTIPKNVWFGALVNVPDSFTLASCTVAPGFDFHDFELANRLDLIRDFPQHQSIIEKLTK